MNCGERRNLPIVKKCCFCVPIREGVIIFGYVNIILSVFSLLLLIFLLVDEVFNGKPVDSEHVDPRTHLFVTIVFVVIDFVMTVILLVGAHKRKIRLLRVYLYVGVVLQILPLIIDFAFFKLSSGIFEYIAYFFLFGLNAYLLFLVYNTVHSIEENRHVLYVPHQNPLINSN